MSERNQSAKREGMAAFHRHELREPPRRWKNRLKIESWLYGYDFAARISLEMSEEKLLRAKRLAGG